MDPANTVTDEES